MNAQLKVAAVVSIDALSSLAKEFKQGFIESSELMNEQLSGRRFIFNRDGRDTYPFMSWDDAAEGQAFPIAQTTRSITIASTDSSCILLGETSDATVYSVRAAVCFASRGSVQGYFRIGPMIVYLSPKGSYGLPTPLERYELRVAMSDHAIAERMIRNTMERKITSSLLCFPDKMIIMADGSLKHPLDVYPGELLRAHGSGSCLVGFSKSSALISSSRFTSVVSRAKGAAYCPVEEGSIPTVIAKFSNDGLAFRLDLARVADSVPEVLSCILSNDGFCVGYPESLRVAHHLSVFSRSEVTALKAYLTKRYSLRRLPSFGLRRITLGGLSNSG